MTDERDIDTLEHERHHPQAVRAEATGYAAVRVRHGICRHAEHGYRAMRQIGERRTWIGRWHPTEAAARRDVTAARDHLYELAAQHGIELERLPNGVAGAWVPVTDPPSEQP